jgi:hypothetical protein
MLSSSRNKILTKPISKSAVSLSCNSVGIKPTLVYPLNFSQMTSFVSDWPAYRSDKLKAIKRFRASVKIVQTLISAIAKMQTKSNFTCGITDDRQIKNFTRSSSNDLFFDVNFFKRPKEVSSLCGISGS